MDIIEMLKVVLLGVVEGITEWLPISSTGHMLLVDAFFPLKASEAFKEMFFVVIQLGAILAVIVLHWKMMIPFGFAAKSAAGGKHMQKQGLAPKKEVFSLWFKVLVACVPSGIIGLLFDDYIEEHFGTPLIIAAMLIIYGVLFIVVERWNKGRSPRIGQLSQMSYKIAFFIGAFQVLSLIPGTSRSGATIIGALLLGVSRITAAEFTFFLAVPTMLGASAYKLVKFGLNFTSIELVILLAGMIVAFVVSVLTIKFLMGYIKKHDFQAFGWYRIVLGIVLIAYFLLFAK